MKALGDRLLAIVLPRTDRKHVLDELDELFQGQVRRIGKVEAERWRRRQVLGFFLRALPTFWWKRPLSGFVAIMAQRDGPKGFWDTVGQDLRFALRSFRRRPGFSVTAILILGVGIGATTTIFGVVDTVMLRPLPYPDPGELALFGGYPGTRPFFFNRWQDELESFERVGAAWNVPATLNGEGIPRRLRVSRVTLDLLPLLGAVPDQGRLFIKDDFTAGRRVGILGHGLWESQWGGDPGIVGKSIVVEGQPVLVAGVLSPGFEAPEAITGPVVDLWLPIDVDNPEIATWGVLSVAGRLKDNVSLAAAQAEVTRVTRNLSDGYPDLSARQNGFLDHTELVPLQTATFGGIGSSLVFLMGAVLLMLAIACSNVANLLLAHGTGRVREFALRGALGAGRPRLVRQLLTESVVLSAFGGLVGILFAFIGIGLFLQFNPGGVPRIQHLAVDPRILGFALAASLLTGIVFGLFPALLSSGREVVDSLKEGGSASAGSRGGRRMRSGLVVTEIALALVLLTGAGLLLRSLMALARVDPGFQQDQLVLAPLHLGSDYDAPRRRQFTEDIAARLETLPGTEGVAAGMTAPFQYLGANRCCIWHDVREVSDAGGVSTLPTVMAHAVTPGYFKTLGAELVRGREFEDSDEDGDGLVAVINQQTARHFFGEENPVGRRLEVGGWGSFTVVGVARGLLHWGVSEGLTPGVYVPYAQWGSGLEHYALLVRSTLDPGTLAPLIREAVWDADPNLPVEDIIPMDLRVDASMAGQRFLVLLLGTFAAVALVLATGGIYGTMLQTVNHRKKEMGIRLALGAGGGQVIGSIMMRGLGLTVVGIGLGMGFALGLTRVLRFWVVGIGRVDPVTLAAVVCVLGGSALVACLIPALKAARIDALGTLKAE